MRTPDPPLASGIGIDPDFWRGRRVLVTGHTGFKGGWLCLWLESLGAEVSGYALKPGTPGIFSAAMVAKGMRHQLGDVRDLAPLEREFGRARPEVVFHLAAQSLVRPSYADPADTYSTNVMGTVNVLEAVRRANATDAAPTRAVVVVTSDKCYRNNEWPWAYRESDRLGGHDPYSNSKACAELVTAAYHSSFFKALPALGLASARAGNVIGGGDWSGERLVPDCIAAFAEGRPVLLRNPAAVRPWQHVLEPLAGYLLLAQRLASGESGFDTAWNFGPDPESERSVGEVTTMLANAWGDDASWETVHSEQPHEAQLLKLDSSKARSLLRWQPRLSLSQAVTLTADWYRAWIERVPMRDVTLDQIQFYNRR